MMGVIVPALNALFALMFQITFSNIVALILFIPVVLSVWRLKSGPVWFQNRSVN